jgi:signal transduction histidine kinase
VLKQYRNLIFDKYVQVKARSRGELKSKGLGLTFCKLAVEAITLDLVEGEAGQGAVFCFTLPREYRAALS